MTPFVNETVFVSPILENEFSKRVKTFKNHSVIYNGIDLDQSNLGSMRDYEQLVKSNSFDHIVGAVGNIKHVKAYDVLVKAAKIVATQHPKAKFLIVGEVFDKDWGIKTKLDELINDLQLQNNVHFLGFRNDVKNYYKFSFLFMSIPPHC